MLQQLAWSRILRLIPSRLQGPREGQAQWLEGPLSRADREDQLDLEGSWTARSREMSLEQFAVMSHQMRCSCVAGYSVPHRLMEPCYVRSIASVG